MPRRTPWPAWPGWRSPSATRRWPRPSCRYWDIGPSKGPEPTRRSMAPWRITGATPGGRRSRPEPSKFSARPWPVRCWEGPVDLALPDVATQFAVAADRAFSGAGGVELARRAEVDPALRMREIKVVLDALGVPDLDPRADLDSSIMAAEFVRVAGRYIIPFPVVAYVAARPEDGVPVALASAAPLRVDHGDLFGTWVLHDLD